MDNLSMIRMESGSKGDVSSVLRMFTEQYNDCFDFKFLEQDNVLDRLWTIIFKNLADCDAENLHEICLKALRILSRDKTFLDKLASEQRIDILLNIAMLNVTKIDRINSVKNYGSVVESLKCLCNLSFNSPKVQAICSKNGTMDAAVRRLRMHPDANLPHPVKLFDVKLLHIITALNGDVRPRLREELHACTYLMEALDFILKEGGGYSHDNQLQYFPALDENAVELSCEILKVLFTLTVKPISVGIEEEFEHADRLLTILRELLLSSTPPHMSDNLVRHIVNLLTNVPSSSYEILMPQEEDEYNGEAIDIIIAFLDRQLSKSDGQTYENLAPVLIVLTEGSRVHRTLRKYIRNRIIPPLKDVMSKPEEGTAIRNKLCRLLTSVNINLRNIVGEFFFVLCKENVNRMIKYTGFGNAAGMFASRGLLNKPVNVDCSSDSEDSETEEYLQYKDLGNVLFIADIRSKMKNGSRNQPGRINPVTGVYEPPRSNPTSQMTEEQLEYETMKLVSDLDRLQRSGIIQPCRIGNDGKPEPVEHVLQLKNDN